MTAEHTIEGNVTSLDQLRDRDGKYLIGIVNVTGYVRLNGLELERLPVRFGAVGRDFYCHKNRLISLEGAPVSVGARFWCNENQLTSLEGVPSTVVGSFDCSNNQLITLEGAPVTVGGYFSCSGIGLTSLVSVHRILRRVGGGLYIWDNPIESGGIGLVLVEGLTEINTDQPAFKIINKYLGQGKKGLLRCQEALHEAGFGEHAQL